MAVFALITKGAAAIARGEDKISHERIDRSLHLAKHAHTAAHGENPNTIN